MCQFPVNIQVQVISHEWDGLPRPIGITVPCGKCLECRKKRAREWMFRLEEESKNWKFVSMVNLSYDSHHLPVWNGERVVFGEHHKGVSTLHYPDVQKFFKKLRHECNGNLRFKYFCVGEYGPNGTERPHYHIILFHNALAIKELNTVVQRVWNKGYAPCNSATSGRLSYVASYATNGCPSGRLRHATEFCHMSLRSPIGESWLNTRMAFVLKERGQFSFKRQFTNRHGNVVTYTMSIPRFYREKMDIYNFYEDLREMQCKKLFRDLHNPPSSEPTVKICGCLDVSYRYYQKCKDTYKKFVASHARRVKEQHIRYSFSEWLHNYHFDLIRKRQKPKILQNVMNM